MSGEETLVPLTIFTGGFATLFGIYYLRSRENMALIERGFHPRAGRKMTRTPYTLRYGLLLAGAGLGLLLAFLIDTNIYHPAIPLGDGYMSHQEYPQIYFALIALFGGLGLILSYRIEKKEGIPVSIEEESLPPDPRKPGPDDQLIS